MRSIVLVCVLGLVALVAGQSTGNGELLQAINAALYRWQSSGAAATSWNTAYGYTYDAPICPQVDYPTTPTPGGTLSAILASGSLRIGSDYPSPPLYYNDVNGNPIGFDIDFTNFLVSELRTKYSNTNLTTTRIVTPFPDLLSTLNQASYPFAAASGGMFVTDARKQIVNFACNISIGGLSGIVMTSNATLYPNIDAIAKAGVIVGVLPGTVQETTARNGGATVVAVTSADAAWPLLQNGTINAWLGARTTLSYWLRVNAGPAAQLTLIPAWGGSNGVAWAVRKDTVTTTTATSAAVPVVVATSVLAAAAAAALLL